MGWTASDARDLSARLLGRMGSRWDHVQAVGRIADRLAVDRCVPDVVASAAWLHDIGYAPQIRGTGMHALDGALYLQQLGAPTDLLALVGHHTGARYEAHELGLSKQWSELPVPDGQQLSALTLVDLVVGPTGELVDPRDRVAEILARYAPDNPVHRAVSTSGHELIATATKAKKSLGLPDEWPLTLTQSVL